MGETTGMILLERQLGIFEYALKGCGCMGVEYLWFCVVCGSVKRKRGGEEPVVRSPFVLVRGPVVWYSNSTYSVRLLRRRHP